MFAPWARWFHLQEFRDAIYVIIGSIFFSKIRIRISDLRISWTCSKSLNMFPLTKTTVR
jgi:hypothetical protein